MMKFFLLAVAFGVAAMPAAGLAQPATTAVAAQPITATHVWARPAPPNAKTGAAYATLATATTPDQLIGASTPIAAVAEVHETIRDGDIMKMRPVAGVPIEPGKPATLAPGGYHIMLMGVTVPLSVGTTFPLTLKFQHAPPLTTIVRVEAPGAAAPPNMPMPGMQH